MFSCLDAALQSQLARVLSSAQSRLSLLCEPPGPGNGLGNSYYRTRAHCITSAYVSLAKRRAAAARSAAQEAEAEENETEVYGDDDGPDEPPMPPPPPPPPPPPAAPMIAVA